jgi:hypothetical protein
LLIACGGHSEINPDPNPGDGGGDPGGDDGKPEEIVCDSVSVVPTIVAIDESDYTVYYVDSGPLGSDANDGLSENTPFKSLSKVSAFTKGSKTKVLLKSGASFTGYLTLSNLNGTDTKPFIIDKYGGSERPIINGNGVTSAVDIQEGNIRFRNIRVTNSNGNRGIHVAPKVAGAFKNVQISGCRIENVNWVGTDNIINVNPANLNVETICPNARYLRNNGGIVFEANTAASVGASWFEDIFITNNEIFKVSYTGIWVNTQWGKRPGITWGNNNYVDDTNGWYPAKNIIVQNNDLSYTGGDAIVLIATKDSFLDHNTAMHANYLGRSGSANAGIWPHSSINFVMQFNEVGYTHLQHGSTDGEGLNIDIACVNALVQYNYSHHNDGGGMLICNNKSEINGQERTGDHRGTVVRNNLFYDNGINSNVGAFLTISSAVGKTSVYNNTVVLTPRLMNPRLILSADWAKVGKSSDFTFRNNIFVATSTVTAGFELSYIVNCVFENNLAFQIGDVKSKINDNKLLTYNPKLIIPEVWDGYVNGLKFKPVEKKVFENGLVFDGMSEKDMGGTSVTGKKYIGAFCE